MECVSRAYPTSDGKRTEGVHRTNDTPVRAGLPVKRQPAPFVTLKPRMQTGRRAAPAPSFISENPSVSLFLFQSLLPSSFSKP